ncbi:MAG TPA: hypothetical protein VGI05_22035 [Streptosporangiaceae bacterium]|jgi:Cu2+-containing amine oxidase
MPRLSSHRARTGTGILRRAERWPCGDFPAHAARDTGLPAWTEADRSIENIDVVLWYVFGLHHITWPVMPAGVVLFWLKPYGFSGATPRTTCRQATTTKGGEVAPPAVRLTSTAWR